MQQDLQALMAKAENRELSEQEELQLLREIDFSYDVLIKFLEELKMEQLKSEIQ
jgi:hypothetical protein